MSRSLGFAVALLTMAPLYVLAQSPSARTYVHRIEFVGSDRIDDQVLRNQLLQFEGTYLNTVALEQSRARIERLPFVAQAEVAIEPLKGVTDQANIVITVTDAPARKYGIGGGYSQSQRASVNGYFVNENLFGRGQRFSARLDTSDIRTSFDLAHTDPYAHNNRLSRTFALAYRDIDQLTVDASELDTEVLAGRLDYQYQVAERQSLRVGLSLQIAELVSGSTSSEQLRNWVSANGDTGLRFGFPTTEYRTAELLLGWHFDSRQGAAFPISGREQLFSVRATLPGSEVEYATAEYELNQYWPLGRHWTAHLGAKLGYGRAIGADTTALPPNLNWFAGGPGSVRGYRENSLGPRDNLNNPYGGNLYTAAQFELFAPLPEKWRKRLQLALFYDIGNVYSTENVRFQDDNTEDLDYGFDVSELRQSAGIAARIRLPMGIIGLSYGVPLNDRSDNLNRFQQDDVDNFQVTVGIEF